MDDCQFVEKSFSKAAERSWTEFLVRAFFFQRQALNYLNWIVNDLLGIFFSNEPTINLFLCTYKIFPSYALRTTIWKKSMYTRCYVMNYTCVCKYISLHISGGLEIRGARCRAALWGPKAQMIISIKGNAAQFGHYYEEFT